jgi:hypothetical protein
MMADDPIGRMKAARDAMKQDGSVSVRNSVVLTALARVGAACYT